MTATPAVVIAAPASEAGKTTVATGLMGALRAAGHRVAGFKVGPDFIDPGYHALATGRPGRNLDPILVGEDRIGPLYRHGATGAGIAVVEGVMGLFDGRIDPDVTTGVAAGSTARVAALLGAPVLLVVDGRGQSHSIGALLHGFTTFDPATRIAGVILNRVGSPRHRAVLESACEQAGVPVLGAIPRDTELAVPSRHLGLVTAVEHGRAAADAVAAMAALAARHLDLEAITALADTRAPGPAWDPRAEVGAPVTGEPLVALAAGKAFSFGYPEHAELLRAAGAQVAEFDPLADPLPAGAGALVLPGGFPEQYAPELSANSALREQIAALARRAPVHAECAGLTYLATDLDGAPMCAVLHGSARFTDRLTLGYRDAVAATDSPAHPAGARVVGHEFHRTAVRFAAAPAPAWLYRGTDGATVADGVAGPRLHAAYLHTHPAGHPQAVRRFVAHAVRLAG